MMVIEPGVTQVMAEGRWCRDGVEAVDRELMENTEMEDPWVILQVFNKCPLARHIPAGSRVKNKTDALCVCVGLTF